MARVAVHPRVMQRHPDISEEDVAHAWENFVCRSERYDSGDWYLVSVGFDSAGRALEMVAVQTSDGSWCVYHAFTPPTKAALKELGLLRRKRWT